MKKLASNINGELREIQVHVDWIEIENEKIKVLESKDHGYLIELNEQKFEVDEIIQLEESGLYRVEIEGYTIDVQISDPINNALNLNIDQSGEILSPITGQISKILVKEGQLINEGEGLLLISAMKMENQIKSPVSGVIKNINVKNNENVTSGRLLVTIVPKE